jgi:hypothetical protein
MKLKFIILSFLLCVGLAACAPAGPAPTPAASHTQTTTLAVITDTPTLPPVPTATIVTPGNGFNVPLEEWNGIPVIKGASMGNGDRNNYRYQIAKAMPDVQSFYGGVMPTLGWKFVSSSSRGGAMVYLYQQGQNYIKIAISQQAAFTVVVFSKGY